ncbi:hypothetical protein AK88_05327 [Plasmodium fragile]|uniref:Plasmodium RESA N-terminal domain-containing protein n=1 Tax=Plasmodium fragile TaxID=5857 RepID=A0A0D9QDE3_PLAFR|nr:uncharacterized protein AK88_05327 [Plasmodium fragile]KJP85043.1 hypothetical protein AK88_05327 [Plasmodium fragile]
MASYLSIIFLILSFAFLLIHAAEQQVTLENSADGAVNVADPPQNNVQVEGIVQTPEAGGEVPLPGKKTREENKHNMSAAVPTAPPSAAPQQPQVPQPQVPPQQEKVKEEVKEKVKEEVKEKVKEEVKEEVKEDVKEEVKEPGKKETAMPSLQKEANTVQHCGATNPNWKDRILKKYQSKLPCGCTVGELSKDYTNKEISNLRQNISGQVSKKDAFLTFFYHVIYFERKYYDMMDYLEKWFYNLAETNNLPDEYKLKLWEECKRELLCDLQCNEDKCENSLSTLVDESGENNVSAKSVRNLITSSKETVRESGMGKMGKWMNIFTERVKRY